MPETILGNSDRPINPEGIPVERRKDSPTLAQAAVAGASAGAAVQLVESKWKIWREMTAFVFLCMLLYIGSNEFISQFRQVQKSSEERDVSNAKELREIRMQIATNNLNRIEAENKRSEMMTVELRAIATKFDVISQRMEMNTTRMDMAVNELKSVRMSIDKVMKDKK